MEVPAPAFGLSIVAKLFKEVCQVYEVAFPPAKEMVPEFVPEQTEVPPDMVPASDSASTFTVSIEEVSFGQTPPEAIAL